MGIETQPGFNPQESEVSKKYPVNMKITEQEGGWSQVEEARLNTYPVTDSDFWEGVGILSGDMGDGWVLVKTENIQKLEELLSKHPENPEQ